MIDLSEATLAEIELEYEVQEEVLRIQRAQLAELEDDLEGVLLEYVEEVELTDPRVNASADYERRKIEDEMKAVSRMIDETEKELNTLLEAMKRAKKEAKGLDMSYPARVASIAGLEAEIATTLLQIEGLGTLRVFGPDEERELEDQKKYLTVLQAELGRRLASKESKSVSLGDLEAKQIEKERVLLATLHDYDVALKVLHRRQFGEIDEAKRREMQDEIDDLLIAIDELEAELREVQAGMKESKVTLRDEIELGTQHTFAMQPGGDARAKDRLTHPETFALRAENDRLYTKMRPLADRQEASKDPIERAALEVEIRALLDQVDANDVKIAALLAETKEVAQKGRAADLARQIAAWEAEKELAKETIAEAEKTIRLQTEKIMYLVDRIEDLNTLYEAASDEEAGLKESKVTEDLASVAEKALVPDQEIAEAAKWVAYYERMVAKDEEIIAENKALLEKDPGNKNAYVWEYFIRDQEAELRSDLRNLQEQRDILAGLKETKHE